MNILGIIPARGGSKGIPKKNIYPILGKPLISYTIATSLELLKSNIIKRCIVSTDNFEIAKIAKSFNADVPFMRPADIATDRCKSITYINHALDILDPNGDLYDAVLILQPTSPLRVTNSIIKGIHRFIKGDRNSLISCYKEDYINELVMYKKMDDGTLIACNKYHNKGVRRQEYGPVMVRNGCVYLTKIPYMKKTGQLICDNPILLEMDKTSSIDVDTSEDLLFLEAILSYENRNS
ncbi:MAG: hypothetical protein CMM02_05525 [Rhodopirellula sp.]|nr:hypothetical protein [Rhodopirellula sp.]